MFYISKTIEISAAHCVRTADERFSEPLHGHNWKVTVYCRCKELNEDGMVVDFRIIKDKVKNALDHRNLNEVLPFNPTTENIARWIAGQVPCCYKVRVEETSSNVAVYSLDDDPAAL